MTPKISRSYCIIVMLYFWFFVYNGDGKKVTKVPEDCLPVFSCLKLIQAKRHVYVFLNTDFISRDIFLSKVRTIINVSHVTHVSMDFLQPRGPDSRDTAPSIAASSSLTFPGLKKSRVLKKTERVINETTKCMHAYH